MRKVKIVKGKDPLLYADRVVDVERDANICCGQKENCFCITTCAWYYEEKTKLGNQGYLKRAYCKDHCIGEIVDEPTPA